MVNQLHRYDSARSKRYLKRAHAKLMRRLARRPETMEDTYARLTRGWWY